MKAQYSIIAGVVGGLLANRSFMTATFGQPHLPRLGFTAVLAISVLAPASQAQPTTKLRPETIKAFEQYVKVVEAQLQLGIDGQKPFLFLDEDPRKRLVVRQGEIHVESFEQDIEIPGGLVHDWGGAMFVEGVKAEQILQVLKDYDRHKDIYPEVTDSKVLEDQGDKVRAYLRLVKKKVLTAVLNTEHEVHYRQVSDKRWYVRSYSTRIAEVKNAGQSNETELPVGEDSGFLWRLNAYWKLEDVGDGVFVEMLSLSLSRRPPLGLGWLLKPFIKDMPRKSLVNVLQATRVAVKR